MLCIIVCIITLFIYYGGQVLGVLQYFITVVFSIIESYF